MKTILIIDAEVDLLNSLGQELAQSGYKALVASNAQEGLALAPSADLIIVAVELPDQSGFAVCSNIKRNPNTAHIPVFITSSETTTDAFERHLNLANHADGYFLKPLDIATMLDEIAVIFEEIDAANAANTQNAANAQNAPSEQSAQADAANAPAAQSPNDEMVEMNVQEDEPGADSEVIKTLSLDDMSLFEEIDSSTLDDTSSAPFVDSPVVQDSSILPPPKASTHDLGGLATAPSPAAAPRAIGQIAGKSPLAKPGSPASKLPSTLKPLPTRAPASSLPQSPKTGTSPFSKLTLTTSLSGARAASEPKSGTSRSLSGTFSTVSSAAISAADISRLNDEITVLKNEISVLKSEITARDNRITMLQSQCDALTSRAQNAESIAETLRAEAEQMGSEFDAIAMGSEEKDAQLQHLIASDAQKTHEIEELQNKLSAKNEMLKELAEQMNALALD